MSTSIVLESVDQLKFLLTPPRVDLLSLMGEPTNCPELGRQLSMTPQRVYYHVKALERAGFATKVGEERVKGIMQGIYQASARSIALSPRLAARLGGRGEVTSSVSLSRLVDVADKIVRDVQLLSDSPEPPVIAIDTTIDLLPEQRHAFLNDVNAAVEQLARRYGANQGNGEPFRIFVTCYEMPASPVEEE